MRHIQIDLLSDTSNVGIDGYLNESGTINTKRLQVILDEMAIWERGVFEKEFVDLNWYKGKQAKHVKEMEVARKRSKLGVWCTIRRRAVCLTSISSSHKGTKEDFRPSGGFRA